MNRFFCFIVVLFRGGETPNLIDLADQGYNHIQQPQVAYNPRLMKVFAMLNGLDEDINLDAEIEKAMREMTNCRVDKDYNLDAEIEKSMREMANCS